MSELLTPLYIIYSTTVIDTFCHFCYVWLLLYSTTSYPGVTYLHTEEVSLCEFITDSILRYYDISTMLCCFLLLQGKLC